MNAQDWLNQVKQHETKLISLLSNYHPRANYRQKYEHLPITAGDAEMACENVRRAIREVEKYKPHPVDDFKDALDKGDTARIYSLLNSAWFGVPESISCWNIEGFKEAVALLEDPVDVDSDEDSD